MSISLEDQYDKIYKYCYFKVKTTEVIYVCSGVTLFVSLFVYLLTTNWSTLYASTYTLSWIIFFIILSGLLYQEIRNLLKQTEELQCHSLLID